MLTASARGQGQCALPLGVVADVDGWPIPAEVAQEVHRRYQAEGQYDGTFAAFVDELVNNHLIARHAGTEVKRRYEGIERDSGVGFAVEVNLRRQRTGLLSALYPDALNTWMRQHYPKGLDAALTRRLPGDWSQRLKADKPQLQATLSSKVADWSRSVSVAEFQLPSGEKQSLTLYRAWADQNIQGRFALLQGDEVLLRHYTERWALEKAIDAWARETLPKAVYGFISDMVSDRHAAQLYRNRMGLNLGLHDDNPALRQVAEKVEIEAIRAWYAQHADEFDVIERVHARWRMAGTPAGLLGSRARREQGWLSRKDGWLAMLAFAQPGSDWSKPVRQPDGQWVQVQVIERETRRLNWQDETVRYEASRAIAWQRIRSDYAAQLRAWRAQSRICIAPAQVAG